MAYKDTTLFENTIIFWNNICSNSSKLLYTHGMASTMITIIIFMMIQNLFCKLFEIISFLSLKNAVGSYKTGPCMQLHQFRVYLKLSFSKGRLMDYTTSIILEYKC